MFIVKIWHYIRGYVIIKIEGFTLEKFLNLLVKEEMFIWDVHHQSSTCIFLKVSRRDFAHLKSIIRKVSCRLEIVDKKGLPFIYWRLKKRKFLVGGATLGLVIIYILSSLIWTIEITGSKNINEQLIIEQLHELGVRKGEFKSKFDLKNLENTLLLKNQELSYIHINFSGTKLKIELVEKEDPPPTIDMDTPTNIIADRDGIIEKILVYGGKAVVREGDLVKKGDLLITGELSWEEMQKGEELELDDTERMLIHAWGDVIARTWYEIEVEAPSIVKNEGSEERVIQRSLLIGGKEIFRRKDHISESKYDKIEEIIPIIDFMELPFYLKKTEYRPVDEYVTLSEPDIKEKALGIAVNRIEAERAKKIDILNSTQEILDNNGEVYRIRVSIEALEKISALEVIK